MSAYGTRSPSWSSVIAIGAVSRSAFAPSRGPRATSAELLYELGVTCGASATGGGPGAGAGVHATQATKASTGNLCAIARDPSTRSLAVARAVAADPVRVERDAEVEV